MGEVSGPTEAPTPDDDVYLLCVAISSVLNQEILDRVAADGYADAREAHGFLYQHLQEGPLPIGELAARLGVTQQAVSKTVIELEQLGYVRRVVDADDQRVRLVEMTDRAWGVMDVARRVRRDIDGRMRRELGERKVASLKKLLQGVAGATGAADVIRQRSLRVPK